MILLIVFLAANEVFLYLLSLQFYRAGFPNPFYSGKPMALETLGKVHVENVRAGGVEGRSLSCSASRACTGYIPASSLEEPARLG